MQPTRIAFLEFTEKLPPRRKLFQRELQKWGYDSIVVRWNRNNSIAPPKQSDYEIYLKAKFRSPKLLFRLPLVWKSQLKYLFNYDPHIVIAGHYFVLPVAIFWRFLKGWQRKKIFYDAIEHFPSHFSSYLKIFRKFGLLLFTLIENLMVALCNGVMCVDSYNDRMKMRFKKYNRHTITIWNVPSSMDDPKSNLIKKASQRFNGKTCIAFVGGISLEKGVSTAIHAASKVAQKKDHLAFIFIGPFMNNEEIIKNMIRELNAEKYIHFLGYLPYDQMIAYLKQCHIAIALHQDHPYYDQLSAGNGRKFFSYMQAGLPIIGPKYGEVGRAVEMADCGTLIDTSNVTEVANKIIHYIDNPEEALRLGNNGRWAFKNHFNWESESIQFKRYIDEFFQSTSEF